MIIKKIISATGHSIDGLIATFKGEMAFRLELLLCAILIPMVIWLRLDALSTALMISSLLLMLLAELVNTAIEAIADRLTTERDPQIKIAKDVGSACVFIALVNVALVWGLVLLA